ncbi:MAG: hypothetical protein ABJE95_21910 [Byssovorax sp.]
MARAALLVHSTARRAPLTLLLPPMLVIAFVAACSSDPTTGAVASGTGGTSLTTATSTGTGGVTTSSGSGGSLPLPDKFVVTGLVTDGTSPVDGATVMQGGGKPAFTTGPDGTFSIELSNAIPGIPGVVAAKLGYRTAGAEFLELLDGPITLALKFAAQPDNIGYVYGEPGNGDKAHDKSTKFCGHCHTTFSKQFQTSAHAKATRDPLVQDLYAGVASAITAQSACVAAGGAWRTGLVPGDPQTSASKCYVGDGVLPDLNPICGGVGKLTCDDPALAAASKPTSFGRCADCHAPGINGPAGGRNLHEATGIAFDNGNHCDVCHHVRDVDLSKPPGIGGALILQRPREHLNDDFNGILVQVMYGPQPDVPNSFMGGSMQPKFATSELCGGCHQQKQEAMLPGTSLDPVRWPSGLPTHSTYEEWSTSTYNTKGTPCQFCHMPADDTGLTNSVDVTKPTDASITFGYVRPSEQTNKHIFRSPLEGSPRLIDKSVTVGIAGSVNAGQLGITVQVKNGTAGHAIPTGEPMRSLLLLLHADACGKTMTPAGGMTLDDWGGALAEATVGGGATVNGAQITWAAGAAAAKAGDVLRLVRPTGMFDDYKGVGFFANPSLTPSDKGLEIRTPVGEAQVVSAAGGVITLSQAITVQAGDILFLGEAAVWPPVDGGISIALAGVSGYSFARTLVDPLGRRGVPHFRANDMVSDNRLAPLAPVMTTHAFAVPPSCAKATVSAVVVYRPLPVRLARQRGWDARDYVIATTTQTIALP